MCNPMTSKENRMAFHKRKHCSNFMRLRVIALLPSLIICGIFFILLFSLSINEEERCSLASENISKVAHDKVQYIPHLDSGDDTQTMWIRISDSIHVYSAYHDSRINAPFHSSSDRTVKGNRLITSNLNLILIRIIGIKRFKPISEIVAEDPTAWYRLKDETILKGYKCTLHFENDDNHLIKIPAEIMTFHIFEEGIKRFAGSFFNCYFNSSEIVINHAKSYFISLSPKNVEDYPTKFLRVVSNFPSDTENISVCVRPLFHNDDILRKLVQFLSYYIFMGVDSFTFYDLSISPSVRKYLSKPRKYRDRIRLHIETWNLPTGNVTELWDFGSLAALNDCLYRNMNSGHIIFVDLDEFIIPQNNRTTNLQELIKYLERKDWRRSLPLSQIIVRNTFFCTEFCKNETKSLAFPLAFCSARTKRIWNAKNRSKFIVRPNQIISVGHHTSHNFIKPIKTGKTTESQTLNADSTDALLYHYRECKPISTRTQPILNRVRVKDETMISTLKRKGFHWIVP